MSSVEESALPIVEQVHELSLGSLEESSSVQQPNEEWEEEDDEDSYRVTWMRGNLGVLFKKGPDGEAIIRRVTEDTSCVEGLRIARKGDVLVAVNGARVDGHGFQTLVQQLCVPVFPVILEFRPLEDTSTEGDDDDNAELYQPAPPRETLPSESECQESPLPAQASNVTVTATQEASDAPGVSEFDVVWQQGTLGCGLRQMSGVPTVESVTPGSAVDQQLAPGDIMILVNGQDPKVIGFRQVVRIMQESPKPVHMRFRRRSLTPGSTSLVPPCAALVDPTLGPRQYSVRWTDGPLGVQMKVKNDRVIVSTFTGQGDPVVCSQIKAGDIFVRVGGQDVESLGISGTHELLRTVQKPVVVVFERGDSAPLPSPVASPASPRPLTLRIMWSDGRLGITFRRIKGQIVVSRLTGAGESPGLEQLRAGDWLVSFGSTGIASYDTNDLRLSEAMELIKALPKPVEMCFSLPSDATMQESDSNTLDTVAKETGGDQGVTETSPCSDLDDSLMPPRISVSDSSSQLSKSAVASSPVEVNGDSVRTEPV